MNFQAKENWRRLQRRARISRRGVTLVGALVCLLIVTSIVASMLQSALRARRQLRAERDRRQVELLIAGGAARAVHRVGADSGFRGDTWNLPAEAIVGSGEGRVTTEITPAKGDRNWQVRVVAEYPLGRDLTIRRSQAFRISPPINSQESTP